MMAPFCYPTMMSRASQYNDLQFLQQHSNGTMMPPPANNWTSTVPTATYPNYVPTYGQQQANVNPFYDIYAGPAHAIQPDNGQWYPPTTTLPCDANPLYQQPPTELQPNHGQLVQLQANCTNDSDSGCKALFETLRRRIVIDKFVKSEDMPAELWLAMFEQVTEGITDSQRISLLLTYLGKDGFRWYAQFIGPFRLRYDWTTVRRLFLDKFARTHVKPIVAATNRVLKPRESVQSYFDDKVRLLELAGVSRLAMLDLLSHGLPEAYQATLNSREPRSLTDWLRCAQNYEAIVKKEPRTVNLTDTAPKPYVKKDKVFNNDVPPKDPCPRCLTRGETKYHWARTCSYPPRPPRSDSNPGFKNDTAPLNSKGGPSTA